ncbi:MAG: sigma-70 family RNA polymerase sigma factor [Verrucomicrobiota bacterium]
MDTATFDLKACLDRVRRQNQDAAGALVAHLFPLVKRIVHSHLPVRLDEADLTQEVFIKLFARLEQYQERDGIPFEHWVARLAVRTCLDSLRAEKRRPELRWADLEPEETAWLDYLVSATEAPPDASPASAREILEKLLAQLPVNDRLVIHWMDLEEKTVKEISQLTGWSGTLVKVRVFRARQRLKKLAASYKQKAKYE